MIAPVFQKGAGSRQLYLPSGLWYDWWTGEAQPGSRTIKRTVDLATMPIYARAGAIIPVDPVRQFTGEKVDAPLTLRIYRGANGDYTLYEDDGESLDYLKGTAALTRFQWNDKTATLQIQRQSTLTNSSANVMKPIRIEILPEASVTTTNYTGGHMSVKF